ncbi:S1 family peptidase [Salisediminibacterium beveridgei]|uniref:Serine protease MucD/AlgY associated with sigma factor RpoE n=1 Tax=Salisediminibacterium beveridgei TaxID=632773 RepID=A0A1D7QRX1_9BACI|nr:serine protease [Salisediminibacterium beveridgei]AOM81766.1 Serine protease precursor MucD/AlgY associated with sigma factor RpoE [Salisediminibacterium beveridgei]
MSVDPKHPFTPQGTKTKCFISMIVFTLLFFMAACQNEPDQKNAIFAPMNNYELELRESIVESQFYRERIPKELLHPVVSIQSTHQNGTGFYISDHHIVTAGHVVQGSVLITFFNEHDDSAYGHVIGFDRSRDIALIKVIGKEQTPSPMTFSKAYPETGDAVVLHSAKEKVQGEVTNVDKQIEIAQNIQDSLITINIPVQQGQSGSPVTDSENLVIGFVTARSLIDDETTFVMPMTELIESVNEWIDSPLSPNQILTKY